jgi:DNA-binding SARP family transcriptional activator
MRFLVLGPLEVTDDSGRSLPVAGSNERTILACLVARAGRTVPADTLVAELWADDPPTAAERTLASHVSTLRSALEPGANGSGELIVSRADGYTLVGDGEVDATRFEHLAAQAHTLLGRGRHDEASRLLRDALALWRGPAYEEFRSTPFGGAESHRLEEIRRGALEDLSEARLAGEIDAALIADLEAMVREEPLRERRWGHLMLARYRSGRQAEALEAFERARAVLVEQLGVEPGNELQRLRIAILTRDGSLDGRRDDAPVPRAVEVCPYKGPAPFDATDADVFFGRDRLAGEAIGRLASGRFLALVGPSGSGKTSLLRAGILPALEVGAIPGSDRWSLSVMRPGDHPLEALRRAGGDPEGTRRILAIDQFEEVFTLCEDDVERTAFLDTITHAVTQPDGATTVIVAMRANVYGRCAPHRALASLLTSSQIVVGPMDELELREAIERPAAHVGLRVEPEVTDALIADMGDRTGSPALLSAALVELWTRRRDGTLTLAEYRAAGGIDGAITRLAEEGSGPLDDDEHDAWERNERHLTEGVSPSREGSGDEAERSRRTNHRLRVVLAGVAVLLILAIVMGVLALRQRDEARAALALADARRLASASAVEEDPVLSLLLAVEAVDLTETRETRKALFAALDRSIGDRAAALKDRSPDAASTGGTERWVELACWVAGRSLSPTEWREFLPDRPYEQTCTA